ncbi:MAG: MBL fold metallo-hydrolase, partial [Bacteroidota bacterium]
KILFTPGHSPASISFYDENSGNLIGGDVLFSGSIGRTDLPGGNFDTLINSIKTEFLSLPNETIVYCGHGPATTVGAERLTNPFLQANGI